MRRLVIQVLAVASLHCGAAAVSAADQSEGLSAKVIALLESCSVNSTAYAVSGETWAQVLASGAYVQVVFPEPRSARNRSVREILVPLPKGRWPDHVFVKSGQDTLSFTKYDPRALRDVILEHDRELLTTEPYKLLSTQGNRHDDPR